MVLALPRHAVPADALRSRGAPVVERRAIPAPQRLPYKFADAFALLVASTASLADLNARLAKRGVPPVGIERFRPNIVLAGIDAFEEDYVERLTLGDAELKVVKPCVRCSVPNVDPATGVASTEPGDTLAVYRDNASAGGITFGVNAIVVRGAGGTLARSDAVDLTIGFD